MTHGTPVHAIARIFCAGILALSCAAGGDTVAAPGPGPARGRVKSGTGFFVAPDGLLVTSRHVIAGCPGVLVWTDTGRLYKARIIASDARRDLALLSVKRRPGYIASRYRGAPRRGERVVTVGFGVVATNQKQAVFARGIFIGRHVVPTGYAALIVRAALRPGDSGAPVIDRSGSLIGMVIGRLADHSDLGVVIPATEINRFLSRTGVAPLAPEAANRANPRAEDPSASAARISALVQCRPAGGTPPSRNR